MSRPPNAPRSPEAPRRPNARQLRAIGHRLKPLVTVAGNGLSDGVRGELERALDDHELIKVKLAVGSREARDAVLEELLETHGAELVQRVGNTALIMRRSADPNPRLSNLIRAV
jgi:RNA-binding protein